MEGESGWELSRDEKNEGDGGTGRWGWESGISGGGEEGTGRGEHREDTGRLQGSEDRGDGIAVTKMEEGCEVVRGGGRMVAQRSGGRLWRRRREGCAKVARDQGKGRRWSWRQARRRHVVVRRLWRLWRRRLVSFLDLP